ncbi:MAG: hypothetical protein HOB29_12865 [Planctomycetaceae bacterium]|nr:hypothetical protein [Planctomycetaceae bacterium]
MMRVNEDLEEQQRHIEVALLPIVVRLSDAEKLMGIKESKLSDYWYSGQLPRVYYGRAYGYRVSDLYRLADSLVGYYPNGGKA